MRADFGRDGRGVRSGGAADGNARDYFSRESRFDDVGIMRAGSICRETAMPIPPMDCTEIDIRRLKQVIDVIFAHMLEDLKLKAVPIDEKDDFYWTLLAPESLDMTTAPTASAVGRISDDMDLLRIRPAGRVRATSHFTSFTLRRFWNTSREKVGH